MNELEILSYDELLGLDIDYVFNNQNLVSVLKRAGIITLEDLISYNTTELVNIRNMGKKRAEDIIIVVHNLGLCFQDELEKLEYYMNELIDASKDSNETLTSKSTLQNEILSVLSGKVRMRDSENVKKLVYQINNSKNDKNN